MYIYIQINVYIYVPFFFPTNGNRIYVFYSVFLSLENMSIGAGAVTQAVSHLPCTR